MGEAAGAAVEAAEADAEAERMDRNCIPDA